MPEKKYFLKMSMFIILGLTSLAIAFGLLFLLIPYILIITLGLFFIIGIFIVIWIAIYAVMVLGAMIYYFFKPMYIKTNGKYSIKNIKEVGKRKEKLWVKNQKKQKRKGKVKE